MNLDALLDESTAVAFTHSVPADVIDIRKCFNLPLPGGLMLCLWVRLSGGLRENICLLPPVGAGMFNPVCQRDLHFRAPFRQTAVLWGSALKVWGTIQLCWVSVTHLIIFNPCWWDRNGGGMNYRERKC